MTVDIDLHGENAVLSTYGGCFTDEYGTIDDYGICGNGFTVSGIKEKDMTKLAVELINHLILNGRRFEMGFDEIMGGEIIKEKNV